MFLQQNPSAVQFPKRTPSQPSIQQIKTTLASGETVKTLDQLAVAHSSKYHPQALGVLINILDMSERETLCALLLAKGALRGLLFVI